MWLIGDGAAAASCLLMRGCGFLPDVVRLWFLAQFSVTVGSCPMLRGCGLLPDAV